MQTQLGRAARSSEARDCCDGRVRVREEAVEGQLLQPRLMHVQHHLLRERRRERREEVTRRLRPRDLTQPLKVRLQVLPDVAAHVEALAEAVDALRGGGGRGEDVDDPRLEVHAHEGARQAAACEEQRLVHLKGGSRAR